MKKVLIFFVTFVISSFLIIILGFGGNGLFTLFISLACAFMVTKWTAGGVSDFGGGIPSDFNADYKSENIAIDVKENKLWLRDMKGKSAVYNKSDILRWETDSEGLKYFVRCHVKSLDVPFHDVLIYKAFNIHTADSARRKRDEWFSRLTVWVNHTK